MRIIKIEPDQCGFHEYEDQSHRRICWEDGYIEVPTNLEAAVWASCGYCDLIIEDGVLVGITSTERPPVPAPTPDEQIRADVYFLAAMVGVTL